MKKYLLLFVPLVALAQPQQGGGPFPGSASSMSNTLKGSFIEKYSGTGTNTTFYGTASNAPAITASNMIVVGPGGAYRIGTNLYGGEAGGDFTVYDVAPVVAKLGGDAVFQTQGSQAGWVLKSNTFYGAIFGATFNHGGSYNLIEGFFSSDGDLHFKPGINDVVGTTQHYIDLSGPSLATRVFLSSSAGTLDGSGTTLEFFSNGSSATATTPQIMAKTNSASKSSLYIYNPAQTWGGVSSNYTGGTLQVQIETNFTAICSSNFNIRGSIDIDGAPGGGGAIQYIPSLSLFQFGVNGTRAEGIFVSDGAGLNRIALGSPATGSANLTATFNANVTIGSNLLSNTYSSAATNRAAITATGYTNTLTVSGTAVDVDVYFKAATATLSDSAGTTLHTYTVLTTEDTFCHMKPNWRLVGTSMVGDAIAH